MNVRNLTAKLGLDASGFKKNSEEVKKQLTSLNVAFTKNQREIKNTAAEINKLEKEQKQLNTVLKDGKATDKQKQEYAELQKKIDALILKKSALKTKEQELRSQISSATSELKKQSAAVQSTKDSCTKLVSALKGIAAGYVGKTLFQALIGGNAEMEQYITSFSVMLGDAEKAKALIQDLTEFSSRTPLTFDSVAGTAQTLMGYGISQDEMISTLEKLGNLAQGDAEKLNSVALAYAQMTAAGKVNLQDLKQMVNAGVPILNGLAESMGKTVGEVQSMISAGKIGISDLNKAINDMTTGNGQFAGMLEAQSQTMTGMLSTLKDKMGIFARQTGEEAFNAIKDELGNVLSMIEQAEKDGTLKEKAAEIGAMLKNIAVGLLNIGKFMLENKDTVVALTTAYIAFKAAISIGNLISALVVSINTLKNATLRADAAQKTLNGTMAANPYVLVASLLLGVVAAVWSYAASVETTTKKVSDMKKKLEELKQSTIEAQTAFDGEAGRIKILHDKYESLRKQANLTAEEKKSLKAIAEELNTALGGNVEYIDKLTGAYKDLSAEVDTYIAKMRAETILEAKKAEYSEALRQIEELQAEYDKYTEAEKNAENSMDEKTARMYGMTNGSFYPSKIEEIKSIKKQLDEAKSTIAEYEKEYGDYLDEFVVGSDETKGQIVDIEQQTNALIQATQDLQTKYELLTKTQDEFNNSGKISSSTLQDIAEKYPELEKYVEAYITGMINEKGLLNELQNAYKTDEQNFKTLTANKTAAEETLYNNLVGISGNLINNLAEQYKVDLTNFKNYNDSKLAIGQAMLSQLAANYAEFYDLEKDQLVNEVYDPTAPGATPDFIYDPAYKKTVEAVYKWRDLANKLDAEYKNANLNFVGVDNYKPSHSTYKPYTTSNGGASSSTSNSASSSTQKTLTIYEKANAAFKKLVQDRVNEIEKLTKAEQDAANKRIAAIDEEIAARKRLADDSSLQKQIDAIRAELKYSQLDDFSRMELEKNLNKLLDEQKETQWQRQKEAEKTAIQSALDKKVTEYNTLKDKIKAAESQASLIFSDLQNGYKSAQSIVNNNSTKANINIVNQALTEGQVRKIVRDELGVVL